MIRPPADRFVPGRSASPPPFPAVRQHGLRLPAPRQAHATSQLAGKLDIFPNRPARGACTYPGRRRPCPGAVAGDASIPAANRSAEADDTPPPPRYPPPMNTQARPARPATYQDVLDAPPHMVAEIAGGRLHLHPRPAMRHSRATFRMAGRLDGISQGGDGPGGWHLPSSPSSTSAPTSSSPTSPAGAASACPSSPTRRSSTSPPTGSARSSPPAPAASTSPRSASSTAGTRSPTSGSSTPTPAPSRPSPSATAPGPSLPPSRTATTYAPRRLRCWRFRWGRCGRIDVAGVFLNRRKI